jgi:hypothetical protein
LVGKVAAVESGREPAIAIKETDHPEHSTRVIILEIDGLFLLFLEFS